MNPLAVVLVEVTRALREARRERDDLREAYHGALGYASFLQAEVLRARGWRMSDLISAWTAHLDRDRATRERAA